MNAAMTLPPNANNQTSPRKIPTFAAPGGDRHATSETIAPEQQTPRHHRPLLLGTPAPFVR
jgi:hypothetical protein